MRRTCLSIWFLVQYLRHSARPQKYQAIRWVSSRQSKLVYFLLFLVLQDPRTKYRFLRKTVAVRTCTLAVLELWRYKSSFHVTTECSPARKNIQLTLTPTEVEANLRPIEPALETAAILDSALVVRYMRYVQGRSREWSCRCVGDNCGTKDSGTAAPVGSHRRNLTHGIKQACMK